MELDYTKKLNINARACDSENARGTTVEIARASDEGTLYIHLGFNQADTPYPIKEGGAEFKNKVSVQIKLENMPELIKELTELTREYAADDFMGVNNF